MVATEAWISHVCVRFRAVKKRKKWTKQLGGHVFSDRALGRFRTDEEPRLIVQSRTIERGVHASLAPSAVGATGIANGQAVELDARSRGTRALLAPRRSHRCEGIDP